MAVAYCGGIANARRTLCTIMNRTRGGPGSIGRYSSMNGAPSWTACGGRPFLKLPNPDPPGDNTGRAALKTLSASEAHGCGLRARVRGSAVKARESGKDHKKPEEKQTDDDPENEQKRPREIDEYCGNHCGDRNDQRRNIKVVLAEDPFGPSGKILLVPNMRDLPRENVEPGNAERVL